MALFNDGWARGTAMFFAGSLIFLLIGDWFVVGLSLAILLMFIRAVG